jgi:predicted metal-dependent phosphotriesterase family hydrolase
MPTDGSSRGSTYCDRLSGNDSPPLHVSGAHGDASRLVLGGDVARRTRYLAYGGMPGLEYLPRRFLPRLQDRLGSDVVDRLLIDNPARLLTLREAQ